MKVRAIKECTWIYLFSYCTWGVLSIHTPCSVNQTRLIRFFALFLTSSLKSRPNLFRRQITRDSYIITYKIYCLKEQIHYLQNFGKSFSFHWCYSKKMPVIYVSFHALFSAVGTLSGPSFRVLFDKVNSPITHWETVAVNMPETYFTILLLANFVAYLMTKSQKSKIKIKKMKK